MKLFKVKKLVHNQVLLSFLVSFAISVCIPLFLFVLKSCDRGEPISSSFVVYDESGKMSADEAWTLFQNGKAKKVEGHHLDLGFFTGVYFLFLDSKTSALKNGGVIDLGPEVIDSVSLLVPDESGKWIEYDRGGRMVKSEEKKILSWQCCVKYPVAYTNIQWGGGILKIKNGDFTSLVLRSYSSKNFFARLQTFSSIHTVLMLFMLMTVIVLAIFGIYLRNFQMICLSLMNLSLLMYIVAMSGIGSAYIWNGICTSRFTSRVGYAFAGLGFFFLEIFYLNFFNFKKSFSSLLIVILFFFGLIFSVLILILPDVHALMAITICVLISGVTFISVVNLSTLAREREPILFLVSAWLPLFCYVVFRQAIHLLRMKIHMESFERIFDSDYYFGYQICFLSHIIVYGIYVCRKSIESRRNFIQYRESVYFLKATTHELISPITLIENAVEELEPTLNEKQVSVIRKNCERIRNMTILANSLEIHEQSFESLSLENCSLNLNAELRKCLEGFELYAKAKNISLDYAILSSQSLEVMVHPIYLETVFLNLIDNAVKYSGNGMNITLSLDYDMESERMLFTVKNPRGKLDDENLEKIFEFGKRISKNGVHGLGLGLHLIRRICRLYNGDCTARLEGESVIFSAVMHLQKSLKKGNEIKLVQENKGRRTSRTQDLYEKSIREKLANVKILLVEDDIILQQSMRDFLSVYCTVLTASNGDEAMTLLSKETPRLIISDMVMPIMDGETFYSECRKSETLSRIPFVFLTGIRDKKIQKKLIALGVSDYLFKPFSNEDLILKIYSIINKEIETRKKLQSDFTEFLNSQFDDRTSSEIKEKHERDDRNLFLSLGLSDREIEIALLMADNKTNREIGDKLFISVSTVATHVQHIYSKCNVKSRTEFISMLLKNQN